MFFHDFKYGLLMSIRNKSQIFWSLIFTVILGTLFFVSFGDIYEMELANSVEVVCYFEDETIKQAFDENIANITMNDEGEKLLDITYAQSMDEAMDLLDDNTGLFYSEDGELKVMLKDNGIYESVLVSVVREYHQTASVIKSVADKSDPQSIQSIIELLRKTSDNNTDKKLTSGNMDPYLIYFYNLIAMSCLFSSFSVIDITARNQGNLSPVGARKCMSSTNVAVTSLAELAAHVLTMFVLSFASFLYLIIIGVDFGDRIPEIALIILTGTVMGTAFGFFIGSMKVSTSIKEGLTTGISLAFCFFSGLMVSNIRPYIEEHCPVLNDINPAAMICDSLYSLNVYETNDRLYFNLVSMIIVSALFIAGGILIGRRKNYASL